jgi:Protein of unknown function (DUF4232)
MRRTAMALLSVLALTACSSPSSTAAAPTPATTTAPATIGTGDAPPTSATPPGGTPATSAAVSGTPRCHTADLKVKDTPDPAGGATMHHGELLVFTNSSGHKCTLYGYPGVSFVAGAAGTQTGDAFSRSGGTKKTVTLAAGGTAHATIVLVSPGAYDTADCKPVDVRGYRIYPPDETAAIFVSLPQKACSAPGKGAGQVQPITAGSADS